eukprot:COSAG02_NODE_6330_length_3648_cov_4.276572_2_plen_98_part_00
MELTLRSPEPLELLGNVGSGGSMPWGCVLVPGAGHGGTEDVLLVQNQYEAWQGRGKGTGGEGVGQLTAFTSGGEVGATFAGSHATIDNFMCIAVARL